MSNPNSDDHDFESFVFRDSDSLRKSSTTANAADERDLAFLLSMRDSIFSTDSEALGRLLQESKHFRPKNRELDEEQIEDFLDEGFSVTDFPIGEERRAQLKLVASCLNLFRAVYNNPSDENIRNDSFGNDILNRLENGFGKENLQKLKEAGQILAEAFYEEQNDLCRFIAKGSTNFQLNGYPQLLRDGQPSQSIRMIYKSSPIVLEQSDQKTLQGMYPKNRYTFKETKLWDDVGPFKPLYPRPKDNSWVVELIGNETPAKGWFPFRKTPPPTNVTILTEKHLAGRDFTMLRDKNIAGFKTGVAEKKHDAGIMPPQELVGDIDGSSIGSSGSPRWSTSSSASDTSWESQASTLASPSQETTMQDIIDVYQSLFPGRNVPNPKGLLAKFNDENLERMIQGDSPQSVKAFLAARTAKREDLPNKPAPALQHDDRNRVGLDGEVDPPTSNTGRSKGAKR